MSYKVTAPLVIVRNADGVGGDGYFYDGAVIPDGFNDERCKELVEIGMLETVSGSDSGASAKPAAKTSKPS